MSCSPVYIAAPYGAASLDGIAWNTMRAACLARLSVHMGFAPILVHASIPFLYGEDTPANRAIGIARNIALVELVASNPEGHLWILEAGSGGGPGDPQTGGMTSGVRAEWHAWIRVRGDKRGVRSLTWEGWAQIAFPQGFALAWARYAHPPESGDHIPSTPFLLTQTG